LQDIAIAAARRSIPPEPGMRCGNATEATMATLTHRTDMQLAAQEILALDDVAGMRLHCLEGSVWITLDRDLRDIFLGPGDSFTVDRGGATLLHALVPARVSVEQSRDAAAPAWLRGRSLLHGLRRRLQTALASPATAGAQGAL
jgi:hypothetical protein